MKESFYVSFGQEHAHSVNGLTFDKDSLALIKAHTMAGARVIAFETFGAKWSMIYTHDELLTTLTYFHRGVINAERPLE